MATQLPPLQEMEHLSLRVVRILGGNPGKVIIHSSPQGTNTYLIGTGSSRLLIDTGQGEASWTNALSAILSHEKCTVSDALITHWHHDHTSGIPDLLSLCPKARIHKYRPDSISDIPISDAQIYRTQDATLRAVHCPGHTTDHIAFVLEQENAMFTGDMVLGHGTAVFENLTTYLSSLSAMKKEFTGRAYPGHGAVVENGPRKIEEYLRHRAMREQEILHALSKTGLVLGLSPEEIVGIVYKDVPSSLHEAAKGGVVQVLMKLEREGIVKETDVKDRFEIIKSEKASL